MGLKSRPDDAASLWTAAQKAVGAALVWDVAVHRMLLCCNDDNARLTVWELTDTGWNFVAEGKGPPSFVPLHAAYDPSAKAVRIIAATMSESWTLAGSSLTRHAHRSPLGGSGYATDARLDPHRKRLLVSASSIYCLDGKTWKKVPSPPLNADYLLDVPKLGMVAIDSQGIGARIPDGKVGELKLPLSLFLNGVATGDGSMLVVTAASKGELRVVRNGKVVKKTAVPLGPTCVAGRPGQGDYVVRVLAKRAANIWAYAPGTGALTELGPASPRPAKASTSPRRSSKTRPVWLIAAGKRGLPEDRIFSPTVRGLEDPWPTCRDCKKPMHHCVTAMRGPGVPLKKHEGIAVFFCENPMCESWIANGASNQVVFIGKSRSVTKGPAKGRSQTFARIESGSEALGDESDAAKLGGYADWVQKPEAVACSTCRAPMDFVLQIGAEIRDFGDAGVGYVFVCPKEHAGAALWQGA